MPAPELRFGTAISSNIASAAIRAMRHFPPDLRVDGRPGRATLTHAEGESTETFQKILCRPFISLKEAVFAGESAAIWEHTVGLEARRWACGGIIYGQPAQRLQLAARKIPPQACAGPTGLGCQAAQLP
eukprot:363616-Chlamydomonas_euryale.AAC.8